MRRGRAHGHDQAAILDPTKVLRIRGRRVRGWLVTTRGDDGGETGAEARDARNVARRRHWQDGLLNPPTTSVLRNTRSRENEDGCFFFMLPLKGAFCRVSTHPLI